MYNELPEKGEPAALDPAGDDGVEGEEERLLVRRIVMLRETGVVSSACAVEGGIFERERSELYLRSLPRLESEVEPERASSQRLRKKPMIVISNNNSG